MHCKISALGTAVAIFAASIFAQERTDISQWLPDFAKSECGYTDGDDHIEIPYGVEEIPDYAFYEMKGVRTVIIPPTVSKIGKSAFAWMTDLEEAYLPASLIDIGGHAFAYDANLHGVTLPEGLQHIGNNAFSRCESLTDIRVPATVTELESYAFSDCTMMKVASLPANSCLLGELIFSGCERLQRLECLSPVPPEFDCQSFIFEPDDTVRYERCTLIVPRLAVGLYEKAPGWRLFHIITGSDKIPE